MSVLNGGYQAANKRAVLCDVMAAACFLSGRVATQRLGKRCIPLLSRLSNYGQTAELLSNLLVHKWHYGCYNQRVVVGCFMSEEDETG